MKRPDRKQIVSAVIAVAAIASAAIILYKIFGPSGGRIFVSGNMETTEVRVSFQVGGRIAQLFADEGYVVKQNDLLARLDTDELTKLKAKADNALVEASSNYDQLAKDADRAVKLFKVGSISAQKRDQAVTSAQVAKATMDAAAASAQVAAIQLGYADLVSPQAGFVLVKSAEQGEVVGIGAPVFTIADITDIWLTGYINETDLGRVKLGQEASITTDTYPGKSYKGRVSFISEESEFTPKQIQTKEERVKRVYRIKITVDNANLEFKPGMPAEAEIQS